MYHSHQQRESLAGFLEIHPAVFIRNRTPLKDHQHWSTHKRVSNSARDKPSEIRELKKGIKKIQWVRPYTAENGVKSAKLSQFFSQECPELSIVQFASSFGPLFLSSLQCLLDLYQCKRFLWYYWRYYKANRPRAG
jgi:hypothetical protein